MFTFAFGAATGFAMTIGIQALLFAYLLVNTHLP